jgi:uncharacterized circularly permuted ATP-grasp superfamily protein/uncharacterized alpha-E superfamily protein
MTISQAAPPYRPAPGRWDEMLGEDGAPREHWAQLAGSLADLGVDELRRRASEVTRLLEQDGVVYHAVDGAGPAEQATGRWLLDPLPTVLSSREWRGIESGVIERAELLSLVLEDLYGPRELLRRRIIPPEVVLGHPGFLRACDGIRLPGTQQLLSYAADLGRDGSGTPVVLADRAQAPSGAGFALENRSVISRALPSLYRDAQVHRLAPFFRALRGALQASAPPGIDDPRIVILTPGPRNETAFEHAALASSLGFPLVEGSDLTVRDGGLRMRSLGRLEPVHVVLRRVDAWFSDPLELNGESRLGVPGLLEATRTGAVTVVNTLGSGVLENPALLAFLPRVAQHLLGAEPRLPSVPTWWCGDAAGRSHVLAHLDELVIRPVARGAGAGAIPGASLSAAEREDLRARIEHRPAEWVGQERVALAGSPTLGPDGIEQRRSVLRAFAVARGDSFTVMPGGLTRVAPDTGDGLISGQAGAVSKDTWVLASEPERGGAFWLEGGPAVEGLDPMASIPARAAENLWWLGRYAERAEVATRVLRVVEARRIEFQGSANPAGVEALDALLQALGEVTGRPDGLPAREDPDAALLELLTDEARPGSVAYAIRGLLDAAHAVRDTLSGDTWLVLGALDRGILRVGPARGEDTQGALADVMRGLLAFGGLTQESMVRDLGWRFLDAGRRLERATQLLTLLRATLTTERGTAVDSLVLESVLTAAESIITYRRRYRSRGQLETVLDLLLLDAGNPRSLVFQLDGLAADLDALPPGPDRRLRDEQRLVLEATTALRLADTAVLVLPDQDGRRPALESLLADLADLLLRAGGAVDRTHFSHLLPQRRLLGPVQE